MKLTIQTDVLVEFDIVRDSIVLETYKHEYAIKPKDYTISSYIPSAVALNNLVLNIAKYLAVSIASEYVGADEPIQYKKINIVCGGTFCAVNITGTPFDFKILEQFVTGIVYRILKQRARGTWHIYGLTIKEFHDKMRKHGYTIKESNELMRLYKQDKVKTKAKV